MKTSLFLGALAATFSGVFAAPPTSIANRKRADANSPYILNREDYATVYRDDITPAAVTRTNQWLATIPKTCADRFRGETGNQACSLANLRVMEVWFADAPDSWVVCHCASAEYTMEQYITEIGRLPPGIRQFVRIFMGLPGSPGWSAGGTVNGAGDVIIFGLSTFVVLHEAAHCFDFRDRYSGTQAFRTAIAQDTCWLTSYAKSGGLSNGPHETWVETFMIRRIQRHVGNGIIGTSVACAQRQLNTVASQTDAIVTAGYVRGNRQGLGAMVNRNNIQSW